MPPVTTTRTPETCSAARRAPPGWSQPASQPAWRQCLQHSHKVGEESGQEVKTRESYAGVTSVKGHASDNQAPAASVFSSNPASQHRPTAVGSSCRQAGRQAAAHLCPSLRRRLWPDPSCLHGQYARCCAEQGRQRFAVRGCAWCTQHAQAQVPDPQLKCYDTRTQHHTAHQTGLDTQTDQDAHPSTEVAPRHPP